MPRTAFLGVGHYVPENVVTNDDLAKMFDTSDEWIQQRTGIKERRFIAESGIGASDLAVHAVKNACANADIEVSEIDAIIFATLSPDYNFPGSGCLLADKLGLPGVPALDIRNQCSGFLYGLQIADAWIRCGMYKRVALVGSEVHSTGLDLSDAGRDVSVIFGDGAACAILAPTDDDGYVIDVEVHADGSGAKELWVEAPTSAHIPRLTQEMIDRRAIYPHMNGKHIFRWATSKMSEVAKSVLERNGLTTVDDIDLLVPHQANLRINQFVAQKLGLPQEKVMNNIMKYGNTTAASIPLALSEAIEEGRTKKGDLIMFAAFGAGFTWGAALVRL